MHDGLPETTFEEVEKPRGPLPLEAEAILERYYTIKVGSVQFCGAACFGMPFWEGFELLALTYPLLLWVLRMYCDIPRDEAIMKALDHRGRPFRLQPHPGHETTARQLPHVGATGGIAAADCVV